MSAVSALARRSRTSLARTVATGSPAFKSSFDQRSFSVCGNLATGRRERRLPGHQFGDPDHPTLRQSARSSRNTSGRERRGSGPWSGLRTKRRHEGVGVRQQGVRLGQDPGPVGINNPGIARGRDGLRRGWFGREEGTQEIARKVKATSVAPMRQNIQTSGESG